jgi:hypothetical protein
VARRGAVIADSVVDQLHQNRRETSRTLWVLTAFIMAFCACLLVTWILQDMLTK